MAQSASTFSVMSACAARTVNYATDSMPGVLSQANGGKIPSSNRLTCLPPCSSLTRSGCTSHILHHHKPLWLFGSFEAARDHRSSCSVTRSNMPRALHVMAPHDRRALAPPCSSPASLFVAARARAQHLGSAGRADDDILDDRIERERCTAGRVAASPPKRRRPTAIPPHLTHDRRSPEALASSSDPPRLSPSRRRAQIRRPRPDLLQRHVATQHRRVRVVCPRSRRKSVASEARGSCNASSRP
ncbi:hypothetical protein C8Q77DRAFT_291079 [Trametes polyzona]|nr:hypothetical protein C8Q77DRAFT_291079 [Trametes polyzona]